MYCHVSVYNFRIVLSNEMAEPHETGGEGEDNNANGEHEIDGIEVIEPYETFYLSCINKILMTSFYFHIETSRVGYHSHPKEFMCHQSISNTKAPMQQIQICHCTSAFYVVNHSTTKMGKRSSCRSTIPLCITFADTLRY